MRLPCLTPRTGPGAARGLGFLVSQTEEGLRGLPSPLSGGTSRGAQPSQVTVTPSSPQLQPDAGHILALCSLSLRTAAR